MGWDVQTYVGVLLWFNLLISQFGAQWLLCPPPDDGDSVIPEEIECSDCKTYKIKNIHNEEMEILWDPKEMLISGNITLFYRFDQKDWKHCLHYIADHGYNTGCLFPHEGDIFDISLRDANGIETLCNDSYRESYKFLKPKPPENITFQWEYNKVLIEYKAPFNPDCFWLETHYKSEVDEEWSRINKSCKFTIQGFDPLKCYSFQFRLIHEFCYSCYPSDWGSKINWKNGSSVDSCDVDDHNQYLNIMHSALVMTLLLIMFSILLYVCRLQKIRKTLMPAIPDPQNIYSDLFNDHNGNFQEWIIKTENVLLETKVECVEKECIIEEEEEEELQGAEVEAKAKFS